jgi:L-asparaginase II
VTAPVPLVEIVRSGFVEGHHHGSVVVLDPGGDIEWSVGTVDVPMLPRSCVKPLQAVAMLRHGLELDGELLALASASHSGEPFHLEGVRRILAGAGLGEDALRTPPDYPLDETEREQLLRSGQGRSSVAMNCSGKHAAMLTTCQENGWPTDSYREPDHPLQKGIRSTLDELTGNPVTTVAVDGCGAPLFDTTLVGLARAFSRLATSADGPEHRVASSIRAFPEWVSGTRRDEAALLHAVPGAICKAGAESCYAFATSDGRAVASKVDDGAARARPVVMAAVLRRMGVTRAEGVDAAAVDRTGEHVLLGGGQTVGQLRALV